MHHQGDPASTCLFASLTPAEEGQESKLKMWSEFWDYSTLWNKQHGWNHSWNHIVVVCTREMVFKDQRGFAMLFSFQNSIDSVCFCFHAHRLNTDLKIEQHSKTTLIFKNQFSSSVLDHWISPLGKGPLVICIYLRMKRLKWMKSGGRGYQPKLAFITLLWFFDDFIIAWKLLA